MNALLILRRFWPHLLAGGVIFALSVALWGRGQKLDRLRAELAAAKADRAVCAASVERMAAEAKARQAEADRLLAERQGRIADLDAARQALAASAHQPRGPGCAPSKAAIKAWGKL